MFPLKSAKKAKPVCRYEKVVLVRRQTQLEALQARFNTTAQARFYLEQAGENFSTIEEEHKQYHQVLQTVAQTVVQLIPAGTKHITIERSFLPQFRFDADDLIITVGQDGLVVNTAKYLDGQPILAVNPLPQVFDGILLPFELSNLKQGLQNALYGEAELQNISMAEARLNNGQSLLAFNDLYIGASSHVSARYQIQLGKKQESHSSSGIIVSTGAGSSGWLRSVYTGASAVVSALGGKVKAPKNPLNWDDDRLIFSVREPFPSKHSQTGLVYGSITPDRPMVLHSQMAQGGVIFSDGVEADYLTFNSGASVTITLARKKTRLIV